MLSKMHSDSITSLYFVLQAMNALQTPTATKALFLKVVQQPSSRENLDLMYVMLQVSAQQCVIFAGFSGC